MKLCILAAAILVASTGGVASAQEGEDSGKKEKKICRSEKVTGSLTRRTRVCLTEAQWRELSDRTREGVDEMTSSAGGSPSCRAESGQICY